MNINSVIEFKCDLKKTSVSFPHFWEHTIGSGHASLALRADWQRDFARCAKALGFKHVRFHGLLSDDMWTLIDEEDKLIYSFFNIDQICDFLLSIGVRPFMELSFMPSAISSGNDTVFSYKGNIDPPEDYKKWEKLITKLITHLAERYGIEEIKEWFFEVWNEPNLDAFWKGGQKEYFELYWHTVQAIKQIDKRLKVGGPATAKNEWITDMVNFCKQNDLPLDFISTHHYPTDAFGKKGDDTVAQLAASKRSVLQEEALKVKNQAAGKPVYYTEWSTSSNPFDAMHDEPYAAAFIVKTIIEATGLVEGYSYWTFSDIFEENYFSSVPFHGGFGLLNVNGIPKPAYRAFELLHHLGDELLTVTGEHPTVNVWAIREDHKITIVITNWALPKHDIKAEVVKLELAHAGKVENAYIERIDDTHANAPKVWKDIGSSESLMPADVTTLEAASALVKEPINVNSNDNTVSFEVAMPAQGVAFITMTTGSENCDNELIKLSDTEMLTVLQKETFAYFLKESNTENGLIKDNSDDNAFCSIAAVGMALSSYIAAINNGFLSRSDAIKKTLAVLKFLYAGKQSDEADATGYKGFYYHFLDMNTGQRAGKCELSTIDTAVLLGGVLAAGNYFLEENAAEKEIRELADKIYRRVDWKWALNGKDTLVHGWKPESGFLKNRWNDKYSEAHLLYILALGSPDISIGSSGYKKWTGTFEWKKIYGIEYFYAGPLFIHQLSHVWLDFRGIKDEINKRSGIDYFENSRRATHVQQQYAIENPHNFFQYDENSWGFTASDGPGPCKIKVNGAERQFYNYTARGVPFGIDDGTISPWAAACSLPFSPGIVLRNIRHNIEELHLKKYSQYGMDASFNPTFPETGVNPNGWISSKLYGLNLGTLMLMVENYKTGLLWETLKKCPYIINGLKRAGFTGGWLDNFK